MQTSHLENAFPSKSLVNSLSMLVVIECKKQGDHLTGTQVNEIAKKIVSDIFDAVVKEVENAK